MWEFDFWDYIYIPFGSVDGQHGCRLVGRYTFHDGQVWALGEAFLVELELSNIGWKDILDRYMWIYFSGSHSFHTLCKLFDSTNASYRRIYPYPMSQKCQKFNNTITDWSKIQGNSTKCLFGPMENVLTIQY